MPPDVVMKEPPGTVRRSVVGLLLGLLVGVLIILDERRDTRP